jgi:hypothetical protein
VARTLRSAEAKDESDKARDAGETDAGAMVGQVIQEILLDMEEAVTKGRRVEARQENNEAVEEATTMEVVGDQVSHKHRDIPNNAVPSVGEG